ncbi:hypothetical protein DENSPDRAFT_110964 [Dentipellis sp. KUC8613]|nr:hypothetical protein DENSPDRAFT_110964 [Dentipellis sp. KUC8613]
MGTANITPTWRTIWITSSMSRPLNDLGGSSAATGAREMRLNTHASDGFRTQATHRILRSVEARYEIGRRSAPDSIVRSRRGSCSASILGKFRWLDERFALAYVILQPSQFILSILAGPLFGRFPAPLFLPATRVLLCLWAISNGRCWQRFKGPTPSAPTQRAPRRIGGRYG